MGKHSILGAKQAQMYRMKGVVARVSTGSSTFPGNWEFISVVPVGQTTGYFNISQTGLIRTLNIAKIDNDGNNKDSALELVSAGTTLTISTQSGTQIARFVVTPDKTTTTVRTFTITSAPLDGKLNEHEVYVIATA